MLVERCFRTAHWRVRAQALGASASTRRKGWACCQGRWNCSTTPMSCAWSTGRGEPVANTPRACRRSSPTGAWPLLRP